ncbi:hypothetical protein [Prosthecobacter sp.]|uniref:hypothetical protein n=1 Tax=Prosthecobacter sp. TaxID=1965333 RepID=UPI003783C5BB
MKLAGAYINDDKYERLVALAESNNRTLAGQCRHLFDRALSGELQVPACLPQTPGEKLAAPADKSAAEPEVLTNAPQGDAEAAAPEPRRTPAPTLDLNKPEPPRGRAKAPRPSVKDSCTHAQTAPTTVKVPCMRLKTSPAFGKTPPTHSKSARPMAKEAAR